jgi:hypothetical protein
MALTPEQEAGIIALLAITNKTISQLEASPALTDSMLAPVENSTGTFAASMSKFKDYFLSQQATSSVRGVVFRKNPTIQKFTSGSGTYTIPAGVLYLRARIVGGGAGGAGSGASAGAGATGGATTFGSSLLTSNGGIGGVVNGALGGAGGTSSLGTGPVGTALSGGYGNCGVSTSAVGTSAIGGMGASSTFGGGGSGGNGNGGGAGGSAIANTGAGGGGAGGSATTTFAGAGGGAGGFVDAIIVSPNATYSYTVGAGGSGGSAGVSGFVGGSGGTGYIEITEFYN